MHFFRPSCIVSCCALLFFSTGCNTPTARVVKHDFFRMNTQVTVSLASTASDSAVSATWQAIDSLLLLWGDLYSQSGAASELHVLNNRQSDTIAVGPVLGGMIAEALSWSDTTKGLYDITEFPLKKLWGLSETDTVGDVDSTFWPSAAAVDSARSRVDWRRVQVSAGHDSIFFENPSTEIDAGGFAKGYGLMRVAALLEARNEKNYLVCAGDIIGRGRKPDGSKWNIGVAHPRKPGELLATVLLDSGAVFTSGDYENFRMIGNRRVHHIFNPHTGYSATLNQSVTIASPDAITGKYLSTGLFGLPADSIIAFVEKRGINCLVVDSAGTVKMSRGWKDQVKMVQ